MNNIQEKLKSFLHSETQHNTIEEHAHELWTQWFIDQLYIKWLQKSYLGLEITLQQSDTKQKTAKHFLFSTKGESQDE